MRRRYEYKQIAVRIAITSKPEVGSALYLMAAPLYEPVERNHDGWRFHRHRFPIKGGISHIEVMERQMMKPNPILAFFGDSNG